jgi:hypothetical protein
VFGQAVSGGTDGAHNRPQGNILFVYLRQPIQSRKPGTLRPKLFADFLRKGGFLQEKNSLALNRFSRVLLQHLVGLVL